MDNTEKLAQKLLELVEENAKLEIKKEELEIENINLKSVTAECLSTSELVDILKQREGVSSLGIDVDSRISFTEEGPMIILKIID